MVSLIEEVQNNCVSDNISIVDMLRKSLILARRLKIEEFEKWIKLELDGYNDISELPKYRTIEGLLKAETAYGVKILQMPRSDLQDILQKRPYLNPISKIEELYNNHKSNTLELIYPLETIEMIQKGLNCESRPFLSVEPSELKNILDTVKNTVLEWTLRLQDDGIMGENFSFTENEKNIANQNRNIYNLIIIQQINIKLNKDEIFEKLFEIKKIIKDSSLLNEKKEEYTKDIQSVELELQNNPIPDVDKIKNVFSNILIGATGSLLAEGLKPLIYMICFSLGINIGF
ncbi:hypothetical protein MARBORIA2_17840 [Methanobrevibacter arboriphilus]|jgi:hypothetical protein|uniref:Uncharacterized protein n=1 Tax=Methanobrevibacter arboriphilus TaxID=39441 RepID=A0ACA8R4N0_METAZ|nr:hypothetical protein [Methanobrevibacter arboriphilus]BBL62615.1 hypothetical protein MarbSA_16550 [Methanobrevibacter arboriphilus]GLI12694.1 hypothetical protein MARBORIA2_17840 [Methanobrevibacter arboriphilus]